MNPSQLQWIKSKQKEHKERFGDELIIDFNAMNGIINEPKLTSRKRTFIYNNALLDVYFNLCLKKYKLKREDVTKINNIRAKTKNDLENRIANFLKDFSVYAYTHKVSLYYAASLINRDRSSIYWNYWKAKGKLETKKPWRMKKKSK